MGLLGKEVVGEIGEKMRGSEVKGKGKGGKGK